MTQPHSIPMASHAADAQSMRHTANVLFEFVPHLFCQFGTFWGPIRHTLTQCWPTSSHTYFGSNTSHPLRLFPPSNWSHLPYFVPIHRQSNFLPIYFVHRCFSPICSTLGPELVVVYSSLFQTPHPKCWAAHHHKWYAHRVIDLPDKSLKYLHDFGGERCFF